MSVEPQSPRLEEIRLATWVEAHRLLRPVMWGLFALYLAMNVVYGVSAVGLGSFLLLNAVMEGLIRLDGGAPVTRWFVGFQSMAAAGFLIDAALGQTWMHFMVFANLAFLLAYRDWRVILVAEVTIALHHLLFNYLQAAGLPVTVFPTHMLGLKMVAIHAVFVVFECAVLFHICRTLAQNLEDRIRIEQTLARVLQVKDVSRNNARIQRGIEQVVRANRDLHQRSGQQADRVREVRSHLDTFSGQLHDTVRQSERVCALAGTAAGDARSGQTVVNDLIGSIGLLEASSRQIFDIVDVIDSIAYQTNLLAINASVEAARAGAQGRSFAVVAGEVRDLASRSSESAREIRGIVQTNVAEVERGSKLAAASGVSLSTLVERIDDVKRLMIELREATGLRAGSLDEINRAIESIDRMTGQNIAMVEDVEQSSQRLNEESSLLGRRMDEALSQI